jgi:hypothetical protein
MIVRYPSKHGTGKHTDDPANSPRYVANIPLGGTSKFIMFKGSKPLPALAHATADPTFIKKSRKAN